MYTSWAVDGVLPSAERSCQANSKHRKRGVVATYDGHELGTSMWIANESSYQLVALIRVIPMIYPVPGIPMLGHKQNNKAVWNGGGQVGFVRTAADQGFKPTHGRSGSSRWALDCQLGRRSAHSHSIRCILSDIHSRSIVRSTSRSSAEPHVAFSTRCSG